MKSKFTWIFTLLLAFFIQFSFAQKRAVSGVVTDDKGLTVPQATVKVVGGQATVQTDFDGKYTIEAAPSDKLEFSFVGFTTQVVAVGNNTTINIQLKEGVDLTEVVVDSYRVQSRPKSANAVAVVTSKTIEGRPNASFVQTLQGQVPGLNISSGSGQPGSNNTTVVLRGAGSIYGNIEPLYVIDGVPQTSDNFASINPADIESVSVLKDAGATSIYGNRGANGVIVVKTKRAAYGSKLSVKYTGQTGFSEMQKNHYNTMNSPELLGLQKVYNSGGRGASMTDAEIAAASTYDWKDYFYRTGVSQNHTLALSSGTNALSQYTTLGFLDQEGILKGSDLKRFNFRSNITGKSADDRFNYSTILTANYSRSNLVSSLGTGGVNQNYVIGAVQAVPYLSPADYPGSEALANAATLENTPLFLLDKLTGFTNQQEQLKGIGQLQASYKITPDLTAQTSFGLDYLQVTALQVISPNSFNGIYFRQSDQEYGGLMYQAFSRQTTITSNNSLNYSKTFGEKHTLDVGVFSEYLRANATSFSYTQNGLDPIFYANGTSNGWIAFQSDNTYYVPEATAGKNKSGLFSYFGTADYDYDSRFGLSGTIRRDASFRFSGDNTWGTFWSVAGRWNIDREKFMEGSKFNSLKLRASYGTAGNQDILGTGTFGASSLSRALYGINSGYNNGIGYTITQLPNVHLQWEVITQTDLGIDFGAFDNKLRGNVDFYDKTTSKLYQGTPLSAINGTSSIYANYGSMRNRGVELKVDYDLVRTKDFNLTVNFNGSYNKNKILDLASDNGIVWDGEELTALKEGGNLYQYYLIKYAGVNPANGNLLFYDKNGDVTENPTQADRQFTGKSLYPKYQGGFGLDTSYKGFFLSAMFTFVADVWRFDYDYANLMDPADSDSFNKSRDILNYWTPDNRVTSTPALYATNTSIASFSDRFLMDASYVRLRYASVGYNFNKTLLDGTPFTSVKLYGQAENFLTWTKWKGFDAESNRAADQSQYPTPRIFTVGLEVQF